MLKALPGPPIAEGMTDEEVLSEFRAADALLEGHFILSSGLRSSRYLQCARVLMDPARAARLAHALASTLPLEIRSRIEAVVSPAMGGIIIGHEMGRSLGLEAMFLERPGGTFELRRGFRLAAGQKVLLVEDVVTTGLSSREAMRAVDALGAEAIAAAALEAGSDDNLTVQLVRVDALPAEVVDQQAAAVALELKRRLADPGRRVVADLQGVHRQLAADDHRGASDLDPSAV